MNYHHMHVQLEQYGIAICYELAYSLSHYKSCSPSFYNFYIGKENLSGMIKMSPHNIALV